MALQKCGITVDKTSKELQAHGTADFPCGGYDSIYREEWGEAVSWHWHEEMEMVFIQEGTLTLKIPSRSFCLKEGDFAVINSNTLHFGSPVGSCVIHSLVFQPKLIFGESDSVFSKKYLQPLLSCPSFSGCVVTGGQGQEASRWFKEAFHALQTEPFGFEFMVRENLSRICLLLYHYFEKQLNWNAGKENLDNQRIRSMLTFIHQHFSEDITLMDIAGTVGIGDRECLRCFQKTIQTSPIQYLLKYRIMRGAEMLLDMPARAVSDIAALCGFDSPSNFTKMFKRFYRCTPREYRKGCEPLSS